MDERRNLKRFTYTCEVWSDEDNTYRLNRISDLSTSGAYIDTLKPAPKGSVVNLRFNVGRLEIETKGEVIHSTPQLGMGVRFKDLQPEQRSATELLLEKRLQ